MRVRMMSDAALGKADMMRLMAAILGDSTFFFLLFGKHSVGVYGFGLVR